MNWLVHFSWRKCLSKVQGSKEKRASRICNTVRELYPQLTRQFAKRLAGVSGSAGKQDKPAFAPGGFTIVELIVAITIGSIIIGGVSLILGSQVHLSQRGRDLVVANAYVEHRIEALRSRGFLGLANGTTDITSELPTELNTPRSASLVISSYTDAIKKVDISLTYNDQGVSRTYSYTTFIGELGVGQY